MSFPIFCDTDEQKLYFAKGALYVAESCKGFLKELGKKETLRQLEQIIEESEALHKETLENRKETTT